ncbi:ATP-binding cassette subfamily A (ABC1) member 3 [Microdochium nivale]|nr:ATP-binding cassette subfamily A (ABC1) member 3 [Microdochium nivale]
MAGGSSSSNGEGTDSAAATTTTKNDDGDGRSYIWPQTLTLAAKDLTILLTRHSASTIYAALLLPVLVTLYLGAGQNLQGSGNTYGFSPAAAAAVPFDPATPAPLLAVRSLADGLRVATAKSSTRNQIVFCNSGLAGGQIDRVIDAVAAQVAAEQATSGDEEKVRLHRISDPEDLGRICTVSFQGTTPCYGAVVFHGSPSEGTGNGGGMWNYTLRGDGVLGTRFNADKPGGDNDPQVYVLPLQRAVDGAIAQLENEINNNSNDNNTGTNSDDDNNIFANVQEWLFTASTEPERRDAANAAYQDSLVGFAGPAVMLAFLGVAYHLPGHVAAERERGLAQLVDAMMYTRTRTITTTVTATAAAIVAPSTIRMLSHLLAFTAVYLPGWLAGGLILKLMLWRRTSAGVVVPYFLLSGLASAAWGLAGGALFRGRAAQLSGVACGLAFVLLGVLAQAVPRLGTPGAAVLGLLFPSCNMVLQIKDLARAEGAGMAADLLRPARGSDHGLPGVVLWVFLGLQVVVYTLLAVGLEGRWMHRGATAMAGGRAVWTGGAGRPEHAVAVQGLTRTFAPSLFRRMFSLVSTPRPAAVAVDNLDLVIPRGQIVALLGANGSGKSTTLDAVAGLQDFNVGNITIDASGGVGVAPQKNVLWDELTVLEHVALFHGLKTPLVRQTASEQEKELTDLLEGVGLAGKRHARSSTLSGGQKRKLQLAMMLTAGSAVCCVDEVSSGIDPLSRRGIWDILLRERARGRTIILTTHFLDEADLLADKIAIMSRGVLRAEGTAVELKASLGGGFRVHLSPLRGSDKTPPSPPVVEGVQEPETQADGGATYAAPTAELAARVVRVLEAAGMSYRVSSPTIEDVFLHMADEYADEARASGHDDSTNEPLELLSGSSIGIPRQTAILLRKRWTLLRSNWVPYVVAFLIPLVAAAVMQTLVAGDEQATCTPVQTSQQQTMTSLSEHLRPGAGIVAGPAGSALVNNSTWYPSSGQAVEFPVSNATSIQDLRNQLEANRRDIWPGGFWTGTSDAPPTMAYRADSPNAMAAAVVAQNLMSSALLLVRIATGYAVFDTALASAGKNLQLAIYFSIALAVAPAFLSLYINAERRSGVRGLQYSSGVRVVSQWSSHLLFDFGVMILPVLAAALIFCFSSAGDVFWMPGLLVPVFLLYIMAGILLSYIISLMLGSQLATWAAVSAVNGVGVAVYFIAFIFIISLSAPTAAQGNAMLAHYVISAVFPIGSLMRAMLVSLNVFYQACDGPEFATSPGAMSAYGGPIMYLALQCLLYFGILWVNDSRVKISGLFNSSSLTKKNQSKREQPQTQPQTQQQDVEKAPRLPSPPAVGLEIKRLTKRFGSVRAVDDVSFNVHHGEVFALLGPNGAGKSTTISMIRGDMLPGDGDVLVGNYSVGTDRAAARASLGVCPQSDAVDGAMTAQEHLWHYARLRGIADVSGQVDAVLRAVGLERFRHVAAGHLSGGSRRKLSLGIALTGNPAVMLLDEPSSGLDAAAKRIMWRTLKAVVPGRSILLTTHSMEEADALAHRAGILARSMLAVGQVAQLQHRFGDALHVHLVSCTAPHSTSEEMETMREGVLELLPEAKVEDKTYHGQMRFSVPAACVSRAGGGGAIGQLLVMLEDHSRRLGIQNYSVAPTTLNDVFLAIVGEHQVKEEGCREGDRDGVKRNWRKILLGF